MRSYGEESVSVRYLLKSSGISDDALVCHPNCIILCVYKVNCVLLLRCVQPDLPVFGKVVDILVLPDNSVHFYVNILATKHFDQHHHAFVVSESLSGDLIKLNSLSYPVVLHLYTNTSRDDHNIYVVLKYGVS